MTILITGAAGFIGSHLTETLLKRGEEVVAIDNFNDYYNPARKRANIAAFQNHPNLRLYEEDIRHAETIEQIFAQHKPHAVAHLGAYGGVRYSIGRAKLYTDVNIVGTVNLLEAARQAGTKVFVFASTSSVYGHTTQLPFIETDPCNLPLAPYPASKKAGEVLGYTYYNLHQLNFTAVRFFSVYGPRGRPDMMPFMVTDKIVKGEEIKLFDAGQMKRDWTYIDDIVGGIIAALERPLGYRIINLGRGEPVLMADFVNIIEELVGKRAVLATPPAPPSEPKITFANVDQARRLLDYQPQTSVGEGLAQLWAWYRREVMAP
ncbi:MAG: NAD-dependent epimerase/dehydratase family protein [Anaerolineae bacterium]|nr:NAD-dependent epimerase/dehydratase family protein [Anaerolineae bacterium]